MTEKRQPGRPWGEKHYLSKLTQEEVNEIRKTQLEREKIHKECQQLLLEERKIVSKKRGLKDRLKMISHRELSKKYKVHPMTLAKIFRYETWWRA